MSKENLLKIIRRAVSDKNFASLLFSNCEQAVQGMGLSSEEIQVLKGIKCDAIDKFTGELESRLSKDDGWWVGSIQD